MNGQSLCDGIVGVDGDDFAVDQDEVARFRIALGRRLTWTRWDGYEKCGKGTKEKCRGSGKRSKAAIHERTSMRRAERICVRDKKRGVRIAPQELGRER